MRHIFVTGATGFMGRHLIPALAARGHRVAGLARAGQEKQLPGECAPVVGDALAADSYARHVAPADTMVHLVGVSHPNPAKADEFRRIDLGSLEVAVQVAQGAAVQNFVFVSVAQPAPVMKLYVEMRARCEEILRASEMNVTILRPWYVLGPGRWWPRLLLPGYWLGERLPWTRDAARRLGLLTWQQMIAAMVHAVENPPQGVRILEVPQIRQFGTA